jgi:hypothetical protein
MGKRLSFDEIMARSNKIHKNKYTYDITQIIKTVNDKMEIICPIHGKFYQQIMSHMKGIGCPKCGVFYDFIFYN